MIDFYFWTTPNGYKILMFLDETGIPYRIMPVNISKGEQFEAEFLRISPNNKMPAIVDHDPKLPASRSRSSSRERFSYRHLSSTQGTGSSPLSCASVG